MTMIVTRQSGHFEHLESSMCHYLLDRHTKTKNMFGNAKRFREFVKDFVLVPTFEIYADLGQEYKRHLLYVAVDIAYICLTEQDCLSAAKYFETADSIYVQDQWKRYGPSTRPGLRTHTDICYMTV